LPDSRSRCVVCLRREEREGRKRANPPYLSLSLSLGGRIRGRSVPVSSRRGGGDRIPVLFLIIFFLLSSSSKGLFAEPEGRSWMPLWRVWKGAHVFGKRPSLPPIRSGTSPAGAAGAVAPAMDSSGSRLSSANRHLRSSPPASPERGGGGRTTVFGRHSNGHTLGMSRGCNLRSRIR
jgi:hypothetical protein